MKALLDRNTNYGSFQPWKLCLLDALYLLLFKLNLSPPPTPPLCRRHSHPKFHVILEGVVGHGLRSLLESRHEVLAMRAPVIDDDDLVNIRPTVITTFDVIIMMSWDSIRDNREAQQQPFKYIPVHKK